MTDYTISSKLSNETVYACYRGRFWRWDGSIWKESRIMTHRFELARAADKKLTPQAFLTNGAEFAPLDEYEIDCAMLDALENAKPCKNAPIEPVKEAVEVPGTQTAQEKPLTTVPDAMRPAFDYSGLTDQTVENLHFAEDEYRHGKQMAERGLVHMGNAIAAAHDALCGVVAQCDNSKHGNRGEDTFRAWCVSIGITKETAYRLLQVSALLDGSSPRQQKILKELSPTLLYAVAKPSAPAELVEQVKNGDITTNKQYQEALAQIKAEKDRADTAEAERDAAQADVAGLHEQNDHLQRSYDYANEAYKAADAQRKLAEYERDKANARTKEAECQLDGARQVAEAAKMRADKWQKEVEAAKAQPVEAVVDEEEIDRRAHKLAADLTAPLREELDALKARPAADTTEDDLRNAYDSLLLVGRSMQNAWKSVKPQLQKLPPDIDSVKATA